MEVRIEEIFSGYKGLLMDLKKPVYEANMKRFRAERGQYIDGMIGYIKAAGDANKAAGELGKAFADEAFDVFSEGGKISGRKQADLNMFMIYYVFPAVLLTGEETADCLCSGLKDAWNAKFRDTNISYTTYESLYNAFNEKIFGFFVR